MEHSIIKEILTKMWARFRETSKGSCRAVALATAAVGMGGHGHLQACRGKVKKQLLDRREKPRKDSSLGKTPLGEG